MLISNQMRFGTDVFGDAPPPIESIPGGGGSATIPGGDDTVPSGEVVYSVTKTALLTALQPFDCSNVTNVDGFTITGVQPEGTKRRLIFKIDDALYKLDTNGELVAYSRAGKNADVRAYGNTVDQLNALTSVPGFVGKEVFPIIALYAPADSSPPSINVKLQTRNVDTTTSKTVRPAAFTLDDNSTVLGLSAVTHSEGQGSVVPKARLYNGSWGAWNFFASVPKQQASKIQFNFLFNVTDLLSDSATVESVTLQYNTGSAIVSGNIAHIFSPIVDFDVPLHSAFLTVNHKRLIDSTISADVAFFPKPKHRERLTLGSATGNLDSFNLADNFIDHDSIQLYVDGEPLEDCIFDLDASTISVQATAGAAIAISYDYDCGYELWQPMSRDAPQLPFSVGSAYMSRFSFSGNDDDFTRAAVRLTLNRVSGRVSSTKLGTADGNVQYFVLPHKMTSLSVRKPAQYSYDWDNQILSVVAPAGTDIFYGGNWVGENLELFGFNAGFSY